MTDTDGTRVIGPGTPAKAVLLAWTDIPPEEEADFNEWYNREHMRDRVLGLPGFVRGRRYAAVQGAPKYLALYEAHDGGALRSEAYVRLVSHPDPRSRHYILRFRNPIRTIARVSASRGEGEGSMLALLPLAPREGQMEPLRQALRDDLILDLVSRRSIIAAHLIERDDEALAASSRRHVRQGDRTLACALLIEASDLAGLSAAADHAAHADAVRDLTTDAPVERFLFQLLYRVSPVDRNPAGERQVR